MKVNRIPRNEIDKNKWDNCINQAVNGRCYGYSWYLDQTAKHWEGLVAENYQAVFPLAWNQKHIFYKQLYQPFFTQQLGVFAKEKITSNLLQIFLDAIPTHFRKIDINLNEQNVLSTYRDFILTPMPNYLLDLEAPYGIIRGNYARRLKNNLRIAERTNPQLFTPIHPAELVAFVFSSYPAPLRAQVIKMQEIIVQLLSLIMEKGKGFALGIRSEDRRDCCAQAFFLKSHNRLTYLMGGSNTEGRKRNAMHFLLDQLIRNNTGTDQVLDFEGSGVASIAHFFSSFGARKTHYYRLRRNHLPFWMKTLQKWQAKTQKKL